MQILTILIAFVFLTSPSFGQTGRDSITTKKVFGGYQFLQKHKTLKLGQVAKAMESNQQAYRQIQAARANNTVATIIGAVGGFMVGWTVGTAAGGGDPDWSVAAAGAGLIAISIPFTVIANKKAKAAVNTFNAGLKGSASAHKAELGLEVSGKGIGLALRF